MAQRFGVGFRGGSYVHLTLREGLVLRGGGRVGGGMRFASQSCPNSEPGIRDVHFTTRFGFYCSFVLR